MIAGEQLTLILGATRRMHRMRIGLFIHCYFDAGTELWIATNQLLQRFGHTVVDPGGER